ncbi:hypothetical protein ALC53_01524 [Atta colombica]|uniref:Uncharacterized protein n=1 Tax=Atta colombica TaxID=520822 RepID=A0A195BTM7_9HYME|nr:hypothetical protein ALC53_01524 [Atta colombica]
MIEGKGEGKGNERMGMWKRAKEETIRRGLRRAHRSCCRKMEIAPSLRSLHVVQGWTTQYLFSATTVILPTEATSLSSSRARIASAVGRKTISRRFFGRFRSYSLHGQQRSAYLVEAMVKDQRRGQDEKEKEEEDVKNERGTGREREREGGGLYGRKSNPWLYNRKSFQPLLTAFFFPLCCNLFARMSNPAYVRLVTRRTVEEIGSHTVLHTHCDFGYSVSRNAGVTLRGGNDRVVIGYGVQQPYGSSNLPWVRLGTPKKAEAGRQAVVVLGAA